MADHNPRFYFRIAFLLSLFTIAANILEGLVSTALGARDETLALFGFGVDSFIEVISAAGIAHMILRIRRNPDSPRSGFEATALRVTGTAFYLLAAGLVLGAAVNLLAGRAPQSTLWGVVVSLISISVMTGLVAAKRFVGRRLRSAPILADANCTMVCIYMSIVLLASSALFELTGFGLLDAFGALGLAAFSFREGRESFETARGTSCACEAA
ncbi:MAG: cation transporter [Anaerolineales bacterium]|jgi:divalent metal cation (Fe/Co/Zn/Cd) transporter